MKQIMVRVVMPILILIFAAQFPARAQEYQVSPVTVQTPLFLKVLAFETKISSEANITVYVVGSSEFAAELKKSVGELVGKAKLVAVHEGPGLPSDKPTVI